MNKALIIACSLMILLSSCRLGDAPSPLKFKAWEGNPVLEPGPKGDFGGSSQSDFGS